MSLGDLLYYGSIRLHSVALYKQQIFSLEISCFVFSGDNECSRCRKHPLARDGELQKEESLLFTFNPLFYWLSQRSQS